jgi:multidrug efflux pump subunit AcrA (membrane-fusion protein)
MKTSYREIVLHPLVLSAIGLVVVIAAGSIAYYASATKAPTGDMGANTASTTAQTLTATGTVEPAQNPNLAFVSGGRVVRVNVAVGQEVSAGQVLASLDTATLSAQRANAAANLASQQANLAQMQAGPRGVDTQAKQTAVDQANQTLQNAYANTSINIAEAYGKANSGIGSDTDTLFNQPNTPSPTLTFTTSNSQAASDATNGRALSNSTLAAWNTALAGISSASSPQQLDSALVSAIANLQTLRNFSDKVLTALGGAISTGNFSQAQITAAQTSVGALRDSINAQILSLQGVQQQLSNDKLAVQSAQDALNQVLAGATPQAIQAQQAQVAAAQANVDLYNSQINNAIVIAPFSGTVSSVRVKSGDIVAANTTAISLNPKSALQVVAYFTAIDITKIKSGMPAAVTLDAYGSGKQFAATVVSVDTAPSPTSDAPNAPTGYKATFQFENSDPSITSGMGANISISIAQ